MSQQSSSSQTVSSVSVSSRKRLGGLRRLLLFVLVTGGALLPTAIAWADADSPAPGTVIENQATGSFTNPTGGTQNVESNIVRVTVLEVAGIVVTPTGVTEAASGVDNAGPDQGNDEINPEDVVYFTFDITNVGNDPTQFFIPELAAVTGAGTQSGPVQIIAYDTDGSAQTVLPTPVDVTAGGETTGVLLGLPEGAIAPSGNVTVRVSVIVNSTATDTDTVSVQLGDTPGGTNNQPRTADSRDVYTVDNQNGDAVDVAATPETEVEAAGDPANGVREGSASQDTAIVQAPPTTIVSTSVPNCPAAWYSLINWGTDAPPFARTLSAPTTNSYRKAGIDTTITVAPGGEAGFGSSYVSYSPNYSVDAGGNPIVEAGYVDFTFTFSRSVDQIRWYWTDFDANESGTAYGELNGVRVTPSIEDGPLNTSTIDKVVNADGSVTFERPAGQTGLTSDEATAVFIGFDVPVDKIVVSHTPRRFSAGGSRGTLGTGDVQMCADLGDAPDSGAGTGSGNYQTLVSDDGPLHIINGPVGLGGVIDNGDTDGFGDGVDDNGDASDDVGDDGVQRAGITLQGQSFEAGENVVLEVATVGSGTLTAWFDWNADGDFADADEQVAVDVVPAADAVTLPITVPATATPGNTYARFRYSSDSGLTPEGAASDGEVEDYQVTVTEPVASTPDIVLLKRITAINRGLPGEQTFDSSFVNVGAPDDGDNAENWPGPPTATTAGAGGTVESFIAGIDNGATINALVEPGDELEYTIPFLSNGDAVAQGVLICDRIPANTQFVPDAFNNVPAVALNTPGNRGIFLSFDGTEASLTNANDGDEVAETGGSNNGVGGYYFPAGVNPSSELGANVSCGGVNDNGVVVVDLSDIPNAVGEGNPLNSYGFIRFRVSVD